MKKAIALAFAVLALVCANVAAQTVTYTLGWSTTDAPTIAQSFTYTVKDGATPVPMTGVTCAAAVVGSTCAGTLGVAPAPGTHSYTVTATSPLGSSVSDPLSGALPNKPTTLTITITIK